MLLVFLVPYWGLKTRVAKTNVTNRDKENTRLAGGSQVASRSITRVFLAQCCWHEECRARQRHHEQLDEPTNALLARKGDLRPVTGNPGLVKRTSC